MLCIFQVQTEYTEPPFMLLISQKELSIKLIKGDRNAFRSIYNSHHKQLFLLAKKYLKDHQLAEDAVQDIFIKLWVKREKINPDKSIKSFLFTCLKNHVLNMIRNQKRRILLAYELTEDLHPQTTCTEDEITYSEYQEILLDGLIEMPERQRQIFKMRSYSGLSNSEIARKLQISINTVNVHYYKGSIFIRKYIKNEAGIISILIGAILFISLHS